MIFSTSKQNLLEQLNFIAPVLPLHTSKPITECIKLELKENKLILTATDLSITLITSMDIDESEDGITIIHGKRFISIIKKLPNETIYFKKENNNIKITAGSAKFEISANENYDEFPKTPNSLSANKFEIDSLKLKTYISKSAFAISNDELRAVLTGVLFSLKHNELTLVATDSIRLIKLVDGSVNYTGDDSQFIMPGKTLNTITNTINSNIPCEIFFEENYAEFKMGNITIFSRLINGKYPSYQAIIPVNNDYRLKLNRVSIIQSIDRISLACNPLTRLIRFDLKEKNVNITAEDTTSSSRANENAKVDYDGENMLIGFNASKLLDLLKNIDTPEVIMEINDPGKPIIINPVDGSNTFDILSLIMPVRVNN